MNKLYLINNPCVFQGESKLKSNYKSNYFEGWYFKNVGKDINISFIPSISVNNGKQSCFIQIITKDSSYVIPYDIKFFSFSYSPFYIQIGNNYFSTDTIHIDISSKDINIFGDLLYTNSTCLEKSLFYPNIMGPFSYIPFMECNHAILDMKHTIYGSLLINDNIYDFNNGSGYIEKDWGVSFPSSYVWGQGNSFKKEDNASIFVSIANIPLNLFEFTGFICVFYLNGKEYKFTSYNGARIEKYEVHNNNINIILKKHNTKIYINSNHISSNELLAPKLGNMNTCVFESLNSFLNVVLIENNNIVFNDVSSNCGLEVVVYKNTY